ncbi:MAG: cytochrome c [Candidatus Acidiferrales bacterium]
MNSSIVRIGGLIVLAGALTLLGSAAARADDSAALFKAKCGACHGADGKGETSMGKTFKLRDLGSADVQKQTDAELTTIITAGKNKMPAYKGKITDDQIKGLVAYIRTLKK